LIQVQEGAGGNSLFDPNPRRGRPEFFKRKELRRTRRQFPLSYSMLQLSVQEKPEDNNKYGSNKLIGVSWH